MAVRGERVCAHMWEGIRNYAFDQKSYVSKSWSRPCVEDYLHEKGCLKKPNKPTTKKLPKQPPKPTNQNPDLQLNKTAATPPCPVATMVRQWWFFLSSAVSPVTLFEHDLGILALRLAREPKDAYLKPGRGKD